jgi:CubicO group peptidase (beta-lactamase class C family)
VTRAVRLAVVLAAGCQSGQLYQSAFASAALVPHITSLMVMQDGNVMRESFYAGSDADTPHAMYEVTQVVTTLLAGIAADSGCVVSIDQPIGTLLANPAFADVGKAALTLRQLLSMSSGLQWSEASDAPAWAAAENQVDFVLARPILDTPGTTFDFDSGAFHVVSAILDHACGTTRRLAAQRLFSPLAITTPTTSAGWASDEQGIPNGATGMQLSTTELATVGQVILDRGAHRLLTGSSQVVPADFVDQMTRTAVATRDASSQLTGYGFGLWIGQPAFAKRFLLADGHGGQFLFIVPDVNAVVVATVDTTGLDDATAAKSHDALYSVILNQLLPTL